VIAQSPRQILDTSGVVQKGGGVQLPVEIQRQAIRSDGKWIIVVTVRDVKERHRAEQEISKRVNELTRSNKELAQYAYVISHDLSEPLRAVTSYTQLLERRYSTQLDEDAREFMGYMVSGAHRMKRLIDDLLSYSRAGRSDVPVRLVPLDTVLNDAQANLAHAIELAGATVERGAMPRIGCDKSLTQVFQNLMGNALKFKGEGPPLIRIQSAEEAEAWVISVQDNGIGIEPEYFERIFILFQRLHPRTKYGGTGIGLAICKKIVERHGGQIGVESVPGQGTLFSIRLPKTAQMV
jgi:light-regulated signal transduction histidine kinase (bacteriophytochrome)